MTELVHDLRMPLQVIASCAQLLEEEVAGNERAREYVRTLLGSTAEMARMLAEGMEKGRADSGGVCWSRADLVARTWEIFTRCRLYAERKGVAMSFHANADRLPMALDEAKYARILSNLVSNAIRFTPEGGHVRMEVRAMGDTAEVDVTDDGCGIGEDRLESVFSLHETTAGYGYGLYIARDYARRMGGRLGVRSVPGEGSTFTLTLPVRSVKSAAEKTAPPPD